MAKFDIGSFAASLNETVSKLDTNEEPQLQYIDIGQLDAHKANFYDVSKLDTLADSIAMDGLQQPLVVTAGEGGRYTVLSGHRRRAAIRKLVEEDGREDLRRVPCLVRVYKSQALAELQLIMANSTARVLTSAEVMHQAQRMEELLYQLKEEGYSFPGRMRAQVAEACQVSESKLARLKVINARLCSEYMELFNQDKLPEQVAYGLAKLPQDFQRRIFGATKGYPVASVVEQLTTAYKNGARWEPSLTCPDGKACTRGDVFLRHDCENWHDMCLGEKCCLECSRAKADYYACDRMCSKAKAVRKEKREEEAAKRADQEKERRRASRLAYQRLFDEADRVGMSDNDLVCLWCGGPDEDALEDMESIVLGSQPTHGLVDWDIESELACGVDVAAIAQAGISLDYVLTGKRAMPEMANQWQQGTPAEKGYYFCIKRGNDGAGLYWWQDDHWEMAEAILPVKISVDLWTPAPDIPGWRAWKREEV